MINDSTSSNEAKVGLEFERNSLMKREERNCVLEVIDRCE